MPTAPSTPPAPSSSPEPLVDFAPGARTRTVPARAVLARLLHGPVEPIMDVLPMQELALLRCHGLDERVLVDVYGQAVPADLLGNPAARAAALAPRLPANRVVAGRTALWVHTGGQVPAGPELVRNAPPADVVTLEGVICLRLPRTVVDLARTAPPAVAVDAVLRARRAGLTRRDLEPALLARRGGGMRGLRRARRLIDELYAPIVPD
ncbi:hypothetical protein [Actinomyces glycerinitolerans]|uniref:AbiEi antitoxin C-terminal domain-containing protein n=1 Tax=Actinomyces glycerinitolerans TaxID=1892869 RepID=A0A1M4S1D4_9ACTO|nr:hypothetical protein [Actinomyces glycerinitolerans]SHE26046.1 Hypothetical protein ACGLYG10_2289 [Actinomyces glycerinitolerans]